jgi:iron complex outermembrane receptor protein
MKHFSGSGRRHPALWIASVSLLLLLAFAGAVQAQTPGAKLDGTVLDAHGGAVASATVTITNVATGAVKTTRTDASGYYSIDGLTPGACTVEVEATGFAKSQKTAIALTEAQTQHVPLTLNIQSMVQEVTVNAGIESVAAQTAPSGGFIEQRSAQSLISNTYIENFTAPTADYGEIVQIVPGTFSLNGNGVGLGQASIYFRGFPDGDYDIDFDGVPFYDTNTPTHHSWAFFPSQWIGGVDFDRSPGSASTIGPTPFGGSIHLLSKELTSELDVRGTVSYGTWNTKIYDGAFNSGNFGLLGSPAKSNLFVDVHRMNSDGYQTFNFDMRNAGSLLYQYSFSPKTVLTGFAGVLRVNANAPNFSATRCQTLGVTSAYTCTGANSMYVGAGYKFLMVNNSDPVNWLDNQYNHYQVPTDFEYVGLKTEFGRGWYLDVKPYTYNYDNGELYSNATPITEATTINGSNTYNGVKIAPCNVPVVKKGITAVPCGVDKYNSYRKYGETSVLTQTSKLGVFRTGLWYEWAKTNRHQFPSDPTANWTDQTLPNFNEQYWTNSYQPYGEFEFHVTPKLNVTAGTKFAAYTIDVLHHADDGKIVGNLCNTITQVCVPTVSNHGTFTAWLPSLDANYRIRPNWSVYGQVGTGSVVPPSAVYDYNQTVTPTNPNPKISTSPKQQRSTTYQTGTVLKLNRATLDADFYHIRFQNSYSSVTDNNPSDPEYGDDAYFLQPSSITKGFEAESNIVIIRGLSAYLNGTVGRAYYTGSVNANTTSTATDDPYYVKAPSGLWVANTPTDTEAEGLTYQSKSLDLGFFNKRVGSMSVDNGAYHNQATINPFSVVNSYVNYTIRNGSIFDQTKIRLSGNNLTNSHNLTTLALTGAVTPETIAGTSYADPFTTTAPTAIAGADNVGFVPGRSFSISVTFGFAPKAR